MNKNLDPKIIRAFDEAHKVCGAGNPQKDGAVGFVMQMAEGGQWHRGCAVGAPAARRERAESRAFVSLKINGLKEGADGRC